MPDMLTLGEVLNLFKKYLHVDFNRTNIYYYIQTKNFPKPHPWGKPRKWKKKPVLDWFKKQSKKLNQS